MKSLQEAYNSMYPQEVQEDVVEQEVNIYEEAYQCLLEEGYEDNDAIEIVNYLYENNSLDEMLYENKAKLAQGVVNMVRMLGGMSGVWKPSAAAARKAPGIKGAISRAVQGKGTQAAGSKYSQVKAAIDAKEAQKALARASRKPSGAAADVWNYPPKKRPPQLGLPKEGPSSRLPGRFLPPAKPIPTPKETGSMLGVRNVPNIRQVSKKYGMDVPAPKPAWGGKPKDPWTTSSGLVNAPRVPKAKAETVKKVQAALPSAKELKALPPGKVGGGLATSGKGGPLAKTTKGGMEWTGGPVEKVKVRVEPPAKLSGSKSQKALPTSNIVKSTAKGGGTKTGLRKRDIALGLGAAAAAYGLSQMVDNGTRKKVDLDSPTTLADREEPKAKPAPAKPAPAAPAKPAPAAPAKPAPAAPAAPKQKPAPKAPAAPAKPSSAKSTPAAPAKPSSSKKKMTKIDKDVEELMQMRAASMDRQGRSKEASELRSKIKAKYSGYER